MKKILIFTMVALSALIGSIPHAYAGGANKNLEVFNQVMNSFIQQSDSALKLNATLKEDNSLDYNLQFFKPVVKENVCAFFQAGYNSTNETLNIGYGKRFKYPDYILGMNLFSDVGFKYSHARVGLGAEAFTEKMVFRANLYRPMTGESYLYSYMSSPYTMTHVYNKPLAGYDCEVGTNFEKLNIFVNKYGYEKVGDKSDSGTTVRTELKLGDKVTLEAGKVFADGCDSKYYTKLAYNFFGKKTTKDILGNNFISPVVRNNEIKTAEVYKLENIKPEGTATFKLTVKDVNGKPIEGAGVKLLLDGKAKEQLTNAAGEVTFKELCAGRYVLRVFKYGYPEYTQLVNIVKGENKILCDTFLGR